MSSTLPAATDRRALPFETASWGRRILAFVIDLVVSCAALAPFVGVHHAFYGPWALPAFVVQAAVFTPLVGGSFGQIVLRLRVVRIDGDPRPLDPIRSLARSLMIGVIVPPLVFRPDGRGLHDIACNTATVTLQTYRSFFRRVAD